MNEILKILEKLNEKLSNHLHVISFGITCLATGLALAFALKFASKKIFARIPPRYNNSWLGKMLSKSQLAQLSNWSSRLIFWLTLLISFTFASEIFGFSILSAWAQSVATYFPNIIASIMVIVLGNITAKLLRSFILRSASAAGIENAKIIAFLAHSLTLIVTSLIAVRQIGIEIQFLTSALLVILACILLGGTISFGIGSSAIVSNILAGFYIRKILSPGMRIKFSGGEGKIIKTTATSFVITSNDKLFIVPAKILNDTIVEKIEQ